MSANLRIVAKNQVDHPSCVLTCDVGGILLPLDNVKNYVRNRIFRVTEPGVGFNVFGTYGGSGVYLSMASIIRHNLDPAGTWRFIGYPNADWTGTPVFDTGGLVAVDSSTLGDLDFGVDPLGSGIFDPFYGQKMSQTWVTRGLVLSWAIGLTDVGNADGHIDISRIWVGDYFEQTYQVEHTMKLGWKESTTIWETDGGSPRADAAVPYRTLSFDLAAMPEADRAKWFDILRYCGMRKDVFVAVFPDGTGELMRDYTGNWLIQSMPDLTRIMSDEGRYSLNVVLREV